MNWFRAHDPAECPHHMFNMGEADQCEEARCDHASLNTTMNVIIIVRANELTTMSRVNTGLAFASVVYIAINILGMVLNSYDNTCNVKLDASCSPATTPLLFHNLEFWSTTLFNTVDLLALSYSPKKLSNQYEHPHLLKLIVLFNVGMSTFSSMLVSINLEKFEILSHEIEYLNELTVAIFDITILMPLIRGRAHGNAQLGSTGYSIIITLVVASCVAVVQLGVYNFSGWTADGDSKGEVPAHYLEFLFGAVSSGITFWFTMDNRMSADKRLRAIMYGDAQMQKELDNEPQGFGCC